MNIAEYAITDLRSLQAVAKILHAQKKPYVTVTKAVWHVFLSELKGYSDHHYRWRCFCKDIDAMHCFSDGTRPSDPMVSKGYVSFKVLEKYDV